MTLCGFFLFHLISGKEFYKLLQHFGDSFHGLNGYKFMASMAHSDLRYRCWDMGVPDKKDARHLCRRGSG